MGGGEYIYLSAYILLPLSLNPSMPYLRFGGSAYLGFERLTLVPMQVRGRGSGEGGRGFHAAVAHAGDGRGL